MNVRGSSVFEKVNPADDLKDNIDSLDFQSCPERSSDTVLLAGVHQVR